jgi:hypothetical protein
MPVLVIETIKGGGKSPVVSNDSALNYWIYK